MVKRINKRGALLSSILPSLLYLSLAALLSFSLYPYFYNVKNEVVITLTIIGTWRYSFQIINYTRAIFYRIALYPRIKKKITLLPSEEKYPEHIYFIIPSYKEEPWVSVEVFQSLLSDLNNIPSSATVVVSTGSSKDDSVIRAVYESHPVKEKVNLIFQRQSNGKRTAMGYALRAAARDYHHRGLYEKNAVIVFMDGDSYLNPGILSKTIPIFAAYPKLGAVTTNEVAYVNSASRWYKDWFNLKFGQRHILFQSHSLSNRVLTLTGRFSVFRLNITMNEEFICSIEDDVLTDEMFGKFRFLMGDDKSSWFHLFKNGWEMLYIPDALIYSLESRDAPFLDISTSLPYRWYGNTLRNNKRATQIKDAPLFIRYVLHDQIFSMWTSLVGITSAIILSILVNPIYLPMYLSWVLFVRVVQMNVIAGMGYPVSIYSVPLMLYTQWVGSIIKIRAYFSLNEQSWSKGADSKQKSEEVSPIDHFMFPHINKIRKAFSYSLFIFALLLASGQFYLPSLSIFGSGNTENSHLLAAVIADDGKDDSAAINTLIREAKDGERIILPSGTINLSSPILINRSNISIVGKNTRILYSFSDNYPAAIFISGEVEKKKQLINRDFFAFSKNGELIGVDTENNYSVKLGELFLFEEENSEIFLNRLGSKKWNEKYPFIRKEIVRNISDKGDIIAEHPLLTDFEKNISVKRILAVSNVNISGLTISGDIPTVALSHNYMNQNIQRRSSSIKVEYASDISLRDLNIVDSYSHSLDLDSVYNIRVERIMVNGALNKGKRGNGYFKISRTFHSLFKGISIEGIRHFTIQWSSAYNEVNGINLKDVDINFHGGGTHHNVVKNMNSTVSIKKHKWGSVYRTPDDASWAPPDYNNNAILK